MLKIHIEEKNNQLLAWAFKKAGLTVIQAYALGRRLDGLKQREIAEELGISRAMVTKHIQFAMKKIKNVVPKNGSLSGNHSAIINNSNKRN